MLAGGGPLLLDVAEKYWARLPVITLNLLEVLMPFRFRGGIEYDAEDIGNRKFNLAGYFVPSGSNPQADLAGIFSFMEANKVSYENFKFNLIGLKAVQISINVDIPKIGRFLEDGKKERRKT
ncbi:hypothetical protein [Microbulbifer sp. SSSA005]|uniref:hypothetical protein n=1 Tax=Microbulbifer sp. SSSA005 TaxID=3243378 RepID=UPI004039BE4E